MTCAGREQITALAKTLSREVDGEEMTLPSVDAALERMYLSRASKIALPRSRLW